MTKLAIRLLGQFTLEGPSGQIDLPGNVPKALLSLLALSSGGVTARDHAIGMLWPDRSEPQARHSLRQCLSVMRSALGPYLDASANELVLNDVTVDAVEFERLAASNDRKCWVHALGHYNGPLLDGVMVRAPEFEEWRAAQQRRLHQVAVELLYRMALDATAAGATNRAIALARRLLNIEATHEQGHLLLIRMLIASGERGAAMRQYRTLGEKLKHELNARPSAETEKVYRSLLAAQQPAAGAIPTRPAIAVLPFQHGDGRKDALLAGGCVAELVTMLGRLGDLVVIDRYSTEGYGSSPGDLQEIGVELDARFLLRGTVRTVKDRLRLTAQLIELPRQSVLWSQSYERPFDDIFIMQSSIAAEVATALQVKLTEGEQVRIWRRATEDVEAWLLFLEGLGLTRGVTREMNFEGRRRFLQATACDPNFAPAWVYLGWTHLFDVRSNWANDPSVSLAEAKRCSDHAISLDPELPDALNLRGGIDLTLGRHDAAIAIRQRAVALAPSHSESHAWLAAALYYAGDAAAAEQHISVAMRLSPFYPAWYAIVLGLVRLAGGRLAEAERAFAESCEQMPENLVSHVYLIITQVIAGKLDEAKRTASEVSRRSPDFTIRQARQWLLYRDEALTASRLACLQQAELRD